MEIDINNLTSYDVKKSSLKKTARYVLEKEKQNCNLSIALVNEKEIKEINKKYRKKDKATDVLSFPYSQLKDFSYDQTLGEIIICPSQVKNKQINKVLIHGILHLLNYDHEKSEKDKEIMEKREDEYSAFLSSDFIL